MLIRKATSGDLGAITQILNQAIRQGSANAFTKEFKPEERTKWLNAHLRDKYIVFVAEIEKRIVGYLNISPYREGRQAFKYTAEVSYYVDFDCHRSGIATKLMEKAFDHCEQNEIKTLLAFLYDHNQTSISFLKKCGFEKWGLFPRSAVVNNEEFDHVVYGKRVRE